MDTTPPNNPCDLDKNKNTPLEKTENNNSVSAPQEKTNGVGSIYDINQYLNIENLFCGAIMQVNKYGATIPRNNQIPADHKIHPLPLAPSYNDKDQISARIRPVSSEKTRHINASNKIEIVREYNSDSE